MKMEGRETKKVKKRDYHQTQELEAVPEMVGHEFVKVLSISAESSVDGTTKW